MKETATKCYSIVLLSALLFCVWNDQAFAQAAVAQSVELGFVVNRTGRDLERELIVSLKNKPDGAPVVGASVEIEVDMPSMPMMHKVPKAIAKPGHTPGEYHARVKLEMAGEWAAHIVVKSPSRLRTVRKFHIADDDDDGQETHKRH